MRGSLKLNIVKNIAYYIVKNHEVMITIAYNYCIPIYCTLCIQSWRLIFVQILNAFITYQKWRIVGLR